jgi:hypothetical protein
LFVNPDDYGEVKALTEFFNLRQALLDLQDLAEKIQKRNGKRWYRFLASLGFGRSMNLIGGARALRILKKHFNPKKAPAGLTFRRLLGVMDGYKDTDRGRKPDTERTSSYGTVFVAGMHFQDVYNYDTERARRCVIHQSGIDGKMYPFCTYNSGPYYRERVEECMQTTDVKDYRGIDDPYASDSRRKRFDPDPSLGPIAVKDYGVGKTDGDYFIPDNYGCCSTAKG